MMRMLLYAFALCFCACGVAKTESTGPPEQIPTTQPDDAGAPPGTVLANKTEFCSVEIVWNYSQQTVSFKNKNDRTARVSVFRTVDDTLLVRNYLFADGEDSEDASFAAGDKVKVSVEFLVPNLSLDQWEKCAEKTYLLGK